MNHLSLTTSCRLGAAALVVTLLAGCAAFAPKAPPPTSFYALDSASTDGRAAAPGRSASVPAAPTLIVNPSQAAAGFDSQHIIYTRSPHQLEYFARSEWIATPARMLAPLIVAAIERDGAFHGVVATPSAAAGDMRLDTEILRLQQDFGDGPSRVRFTLRAQIVDTATRRVLASEEFDETVAATSDAPYAGVVAANRVVQAVLTRLASLCAATASAWQPVKPKS